MVPAILLKDKVVTGCNHGEAFSKLSEVEKNEDVVSGFIDYDHDKFVTEDEIIYLKDIILLRHAQSYPDIENGPITTMGEWQAQRTGAFLRRMCLSDYVIFSSPYQRCQQTSKIIENVCSIPAITADYFQKQQPDEQNKNFFKRVIETLDNLPKKSIVVTHTDFIQNVLCYTHLIKEALQIVANCSITYIHQNRLIWLAKDINVEENRS